MLQAPGKLYGWHPEILHFGSAYFFVQVPGSVLGSWEHPYPPRQVFIRLEDCPIMLLGQGSSLGFVVCLVGSQYVVEVRQNWIRPVIST